MKKTAPKKPAARATRPPARVDAAAAKHEPDSDPTADMPISVLVADSSRMGSQLLADALNARAGIEVVGVCASSRELAAIEPASIPDVALVSASFDQEALKGLAISRQLRARFPHIKIIILLDNATPDLVIPAFKAGATGIFGRGQSVEALRKCITSVYAGQVWAGSDELRLLLQAFAEPTPMKFMDAKGKALLSKRQQDIVRCVTEGMSNREIALRLKLSEHTVKNYIFRIFDKLGVSTRVEMVLYAFSQRDPGVKQ